MNFYIGDMHLWHKNIIRLCNRPFSSVEEMNETIFKNWNNVVTDNDDVYILGDIAFRMSETMIEVFSKLKGRKHLVIGNHDYENLKNVKFKKLFVEIADKIELIDNGLRVFLFHYPIVEWNGYFRGSYLVFGHIHNNVKNRAWKIMREEERALNAGVDINSFRPCTLNELIENNRDFRSRN